MSDYSSAVDTCVELKRTMEELDRLLAERLELEEQLHREVYGPRDSMQKDERRFLHDGTLYTVQRSCVDVEESQGLRATLTYEKLKTAKEALER